MERSSGDARLCEGDGCGRRLTGTGQRRRLCRPCLDTLTGLLGTLPALYRGCGSALEVGAAAGLREKTSGGPLPGLALNTAAVEARAEILAVLASWSGLVAQQRRLPAPRRDVALLARFLLDHVDWLAAHPAAGELTAEIARVARSARRTAHREPVRRIVVGPCAAPGCGGELTAAIRPGHGTRVRCDADPAHAWDGPQWTGLRREMEPAAPERWLTAADISRLWRTPSGTVYRLASEQKWRRVTRAGRTYYAESDVHACFARRAEKGDRPRI
ncbi:hypothetical protein GCM10022254_15850 [Actinomadura meridiana]|uniref:Helix-turn-helix domain-containing protein n=1 Tax=Actinomadura meridiana TaxID=559626 RepID=A0ABP8BW51_9ACTN